MAKVSAELSKMQELINQLKKKERQQLIDMLLDEEAERIVGKLRSNVRKQKLTPKDIDRL